MAVHRMARLDQTGHTLTEWDLEDPETIQKAEREFDNHMAHGYAAFVETPEETVQLRRFDPYAESLLLVGPMAGG